MAKLVIYVCRCSCPAVPPSIGLRRTVVPVSLKKGWRSFQGVWTFFCLHQLQIWCRFHSEFTVGFFVLICCTFPLRTVSTALASFPCPVSARNFERTPQARSCKWTRVIRCATCAPFFSFFIPFFVFFLTTAELASAGIECRAPASDPPRDPLVCLRP